MVSYEVTIETEPQIAVAFETYMREKHIPEIMATGCFIAIIFEKASPIKFRTRYEASSHKDLDRYLGEHATHFRTDFVAHFPKEVKPSREVWVVQQGWNK